METVKLFVKDEDAYFQADVNAVSMEQGVAMETIEAQVLEEQPAEYAEVTDYMTLEQEEEPLPPSCKQEEQVNIFGEYCRICACAYEHMIPIFNETGVELQLEEKINGYLPITVTRNDKLPLQICEMCMEKLNITHDLIIACVNSDTKFKYFESQNIEEEDASKAKRKVVVMKLVSSNGAQLSVSARVAKALQYLKAKKAGDSREEPSQSGIPNAKQNARPSLQVEPGELDKVKVAAVAEFCVVASGGGREKAQTPKVTATSNRASLKTKICEALGPVDRGTNKRLVEAMHEIVCSSQPQQHLTNDCCASNGQRCNCGRGAFLKTAFHDNMTGRPLKPSLPASPSSVVGEVGDVAADETKRRRATTALLPRDKRFSCKACHKRFADAYRLTLHKQTTHVARRPSAAASPAAASMLAHVCSVCGKQFARRTSLLIHQALERGARRYQCTACGRRFVHRCSLETHLAAEHPNTKPWMCARCGRSFVVRHALRAHRCVCTTSAAVLAAGLLGGIGAMHDHEHRTYTSGTAIARMKEGVSASHLSGGMVTNGSGGRVFLCSQCPKRLSSRQALDQHEATHAGARPYQCSICYVGFIRKTSLTKHYKTHASEKVICCKVCKASFPTVTGLINHSKTHSSEDWRPVVKRESPGDGGGLMSPGGTSTGGGGGGNGVNGAGGGGNCGGGGAGGGLASGGGGGNGPDAYQCSVCSKFLSNKLSLSLHMRTHTGDKPYECGVCQKRFTQKPALTYHQRLHTGERPHVCQFCGKGFNSKVGKESHERIHTGERPYKCGQCGVGFRCSANLRQHTWIHSDRRPFMCEVCKKLFRRREALQVHMRIHTGERPYSCPVCGRRFTQKGDMVKHTRSHSKDTQGVTCHKCGKIFSRRVHYKMHEEQCRHANIQLVVKSDKMEEKSGIALLQSEDHDKEDCGEHKTIAIVNEDMLPKFTDITIVPRDVVQEIEVEFEAK